MQRPRRSRFDLRLCGLVLVFAVLAVGPGLMGSDADNPNQRRGFSPDDVYAVGDPDSVNVFNGNLIVRIPLGPEYAVGPVLRYRFTLVYNSKLWDYKSDNFGQPPTNDVPQFHFRSALPETRSNAGAGWTLSLGDLLLPNADTESDWTYRGPDGSEHVFERDGTPGADPRYYTRDGSYLRMTFVGDDAVIHFPDGSIHTFDRATGRLREIRDRFGNWVTLTLENGVLKVRDGFGTGPGSVARVHEIEYEIPPHAEFDERYPHDVRGVVSEVRLAAFSADEGQRDQAKANYRFRYSKRLVGRAGFGERAYNIPSKCVGMTLLDRIELPDSSAYAATYKYFEPLEEGEACVPQSDDDRRQLPPDHGVMERLDLPTGARIEWKHGVRYLNETPCPVSFGIPNAPPRAPKGKLRYVGVLERRVFESPPQEDPAVWTYDSELVSNFDSGTITCGEKPITGPLPDEVAINTITAPDGTRTRHYFSVFSDGTSLKGFLPAEYGLPFDRSVKAGEGPNEMYLSTETLDAGGTVLRRHFVRYDYEVGAGGNLENSRPMHERTEFLAEGPGELLDDGPCAEYPCHFETRRSSFDGAGHYRKVVTTSNRSSASTRTAFTNYTPDKAAWLLNLYDDSWQSQTAAEGAAASATRSVTGFSPTTGAVEWVRSIAATGPNPLALPESNRNDRLTVSCRDARGFVVSERHFGGNGSGSGEEDTVPVAAAGTTLHQTACGSNSTRAAGNYFIARTPAFAGSALESVTTRYDGAPDSSSEVFDLNTGLTKVLRDGAGLETKFRYDAMGRLTQTRPPGAAWTHYAYSVAPNASYATARQHPAAAADAEGAAVLTESRYYYDGLGRLVQQKTLAPNGRWIATERTYDALGRITEEGLPVFTDTPDLQPGAVRFYTSTGYDALGRVTRVTQPDRTFVTFAYAGDWEKSRTVTIVQNGVLAPATTTEHLDPFGRLAGVTERSATAPVRTHYTYDAGDRLTEVRSGTGAAAQLRAFGYDGTGSLISEQHPEAAYTEYRRDARDHVTFKKIGSQVELVSAYDASERLTNVVDRIANRELTSFFHGQDGRLERQSRRNCFADPSVPCITVTDAFEYEAATGRVATKTTTIVDPSQPPAAIETSVVQDYSYNDLGQPDELIYPTAANGTQLPARVIPLTYTNGVLTNILGVTGRTAAPDLAGITYAASGAIQSIEHVRAGGAGVIDRYEPDAHDMRRIARVTFGGANRCDLVNAWPRDVLTTSGSTATFTVSPKAANAVVAWYEGVSGDTSKPLAAAPNDPYSMIAGPLTATTHFWCRVSVPGGDCTEKSPTFSAVVCQPPAIVNPAADYRADAVPFAVAQDDGDGDATPGEVRAAVSVTGTTFSYLWEVVRVTRSADDSWIAGSGRAAVSPANNASVEWVAVRATGPGESDSASQFWALRVTVTGHCPVPSEVSRIVKVIELLPASSACDGDGFAAVPGDPSGREPDPPRIADSFPPERSTSWPAGSIELEIVPDRPGDRPAVPRDVWMNEYVFQWTVDGEMVLQKEGASVIGISARTKPRFVVARVWRKCSNGTISPAVERSTFVWNSATCPVPPLTVDQLTIDLAGGGSRSFTATSEWPSVTFQWYEGDSGNTRTPVIGAAGRSGTLSVSGGADVGTYWVRATSPCGSFADSPTLAVSNGNCIPVRILRQPDAHTTIAAGAPVTLSFEAVSNPAPTLIEWKRSIEGEVEVVGDRSLLVDRPRTTARYWARVDSAGCDRSFTAVATVHVTSCADITVDAQPESRSILAEGSTTLSIAAHSVYPLTYRWYQGESGDESNVIQTGPASVTVTPAATTKYWVRVTSDSCAIDSPTVTVTVCPKPPVTQTIELLSSFPMQQQWVGAPAVSGENLAYAWYAGSVGDETELLTTGSSYVSRPAVTTRFWLKVTSGSCANPVAVVQYRVSVCPVVVEEATALQPNVMPGSTATLTIGATGAESIQWFRGSGTTAVHTGSTYMPVITAPETFRVRVQSGLCHYDSQVSVGLCEQPTITWMTIRQEAGAGESQTLTVRATSTTAGAARIAFYEGVPGNPAQSRLIADDVYDSVGISTARTATYWARAYEPTGCHADTPGVVVKVCIPRITAQPQPVTLVKPPGSTASASLSVTVDVDDPDVPADVAYQWYTGPSGDTSHQVSGATSRVYPASPDVDTTYWVRATTSCGRTIDSAAVQVRVCRPPQITREPIPAAASPGVPAPLSVVASGTDLTYQWYAGTRGDVSAPVTHATSASFPAAVSVTTDFWVRVGGHCGSIDSATVTVSVQPVITAQPAGGPITKGTTRELTVTATGSRLLYQWYTGAGTSIDGATSNRYTPPPIAADSSFWVVVRSGSTSIQSSTATFSVCPAKQIVVGTNDRISGSPVVLSIASEGADESYLWYRGTSGDTSAPMGSGAYVSVSPVQRTSYWARTVRAECTADSDTVTVPVCRPKIEVQPQGTTVVPGGSAPLSVSAAGTPPLAYQWYIGTSGDTSQPVQGQTGPAFTATGIASTTSYWVRVTSPAFTGCTSTSTNSAAATINVCNPPAITSLTPAQRIPWGQRVQLTVGATGDGLSYEWHEGQPGSGPIVGTNSNTLAVTPPGTTSYWVRVRGTCGNAFVDSAAIQVSVTPRIDQEPVSGSVCSGGQATVSIAVSGRELSYAWYRQYAGQAAQRVGGDQPSATFDVTANAQVWCAVTSGTASILSSVVTITALPPPAAYTMSKTALAGGKWRLQANVGAADAQVVVYEWYRGALGDTTAHLISGMFRNVVDVTPPSLPTTYWVRVRYPDTGCSTDRAVTVP